MTPFRFPQFGTNIIVHIGTPFLCIFNKAKMRWGNLNGVVVVVVVDVFGVVIQGELYISRYIHIHYNDENGSFMLSFNFVWAYS